MVGEAKRMLRQIWKRLSLKTKCVFVIKAKKNWTPKVSVIRITYKKE